MNLELKIDVDAFKKGLENKLEVAAIKAWEAAVERTPAAGQGPYATGQMRQSLRVQKTGELEWTLFCPASYGVFVEFGTGPRGAATGQVPEYPNDPYANISYHSGEVLVTRWRGEILDEPFVRHTQGMEAQPFMRPALLTGIEWLKKLIQE
nr:MAG TPA: putative tail-component [Caudoviricetes sp.]